MSSLRVRCEMCKRILRPHLGEYVKYKDTSILNQDVARPYCYKCCIVTGERT
mgnify:CR=1 FL=1|jgi:hypothetical protein